MSEYPNLSMVFRMITEESGGRDAEIMTVEEFLSTNPEHETLGKLTKEACEGAERFLADLSTSQKLAVALGWETVKDEYPTLETVSGFADMMAVTDQYYFDDVI